MNELAPQLTGLWTVAHFLVSHQGSTRLQMRGARGRYGEAGLPALIGPRPAYLQIPGSPLSPGLGVMKASWQGQD